MALAPALGPDPLECGECLSSFDRSPDKASDAAALLVMLSQSSGGDDPGAAGPSATPLLGGAAKREPARPSVLLTAQHQLSVAIDECERGDTVGALVSPLLEVAVKPSSKSRANKVDRALRCGACDGCKRADCGRCPNCKDKPKFGGAGVKKQACQYRGCLTPTRTGNGRVLPPDPERASSQISSADESSEPVNGYVSPRLSESSARGSFEEGVGLPAALLGAAGLVERSINEEGELEARPLEARKPLGASALLHAEKPLAKVSSPGKRSRR
uniref:CXXC-type domain-containing protein n=1 Tax=Emiliania huxleyi TaxID=2903 RepID=A0A6V2RQX0_EMIHU|mmetsp:Transcript_48029/g.154472  ORF Transcript_48029/g.154472 Transcript_48029/m.154472 type:complete len:272 (-) Transcript_48029:288-1103(-)